MVDRREISKDEKKGRLSGLSAKQITESFKKVFQGRENEEQKKARQQTLALAKQVQLTQKIIGQQTGKLQELAQTDSKVADFLEDFNMIRFDRIEGIQSKIQSGEAVTDKEGKEVVETLGRIQENFKGLDFEGLELSAEQMVSFTKEVVNDTKLSRNFRRKVVSDLTAFIGNQENLTEQQTAIVDDLKKAQEEGLDFTKDQTDNIDSLLDQLAGSKVEEIKSRGTLDNINDKMGSFVTNQEDIEDALNKQNEQGKSLQEMLESGFDSDLGKGLIDTAFAMLGLPGMGLALTQVSGIFKTAGSFILNAVNKVFGKGSFFRKAIEGVKTFGSKMGKIFSPGRFLGPLQKLFSPVTKFIKAISSGPLGKVAKVAAKGSKAIPVVGQIIAVIVGLFSAISGFFNAAEISGKKEESVTMLDKFFSSISAFLSSLTFGIIDASSIFEKIDAFKNLVSELNFQEMGKAIFDTVTSIFTKISDTLKSVWDSLTNINVKDVVTGAFDSIGSFFSGDSEDTSTTDSTSPSTTLGDVMAKSAESPEAVRRNQTMDNPPREVTPSEVTRPSSKEKSNLNIIQNGGGGGGQSAPGPKKRESMDDMRLSALNLGLMD